MSASIYVLPVWKKDATAAEWLQELAAMALANPERFARIVLVYEEIKSDNKSIARIQSFQIASNTEVLGLLELGKTETIEWMYGRR